MYIFNYLTICLIGYMIEFCDSTLESSERVDSLKLNYLTQFSESPSPTRKPIQKFPRHKNKTYERDGFSPFTFNPKRRTTTTTRVPQRINQYVPLTKSSTNFGRDDSQYMDPYRMIWGDRELLQNSYKVTPPKMPDIPDWRKDMEKKQQNQKKVELGFWWVLVVLLFVIMAAVKMVPFLATACMTEGEQDNELSQSDGEIIRRPEIQYEHRVTDASVVGITYPVVQEYRQPLSQTVRFQERQQPQPFDQELQQLQEIRQRIDSEESEARQEQRDFEALQQIRYLQHLLRDNNNSSSTVVFVGVDVHERARIQTNSEREGTDADAPPCYNELESDSVTELPPPRYEDLNV